MLDQSMPRLCLITAVLGLWPFFAAGAPEGTFVAVGYGGRRIASPDGQNWENDQRWSEVVADDDNVLFNVAYGLGRFIAVGGGAKLGRVVTSPDGKVWTELPQFKGRVATIVFGGPGGGNRFIAGHDSELLWSTDGETFHPGQKLDAQGSVHARKSACGDTEAGFMTVIIGDVDLWAEKKRVGWRGSTADGEKWVSQAVDTPEARGLAYGAGRFVVVGPKGLIENSHDGQNWRPCEAPPTEDFQAVIWIGSSFLAKGKQCWVSEDGLVWKADARSIPGEPAFGRDGLGGIACSWGGNLFFSLDFRIWKKVVLPPGPSLNAVAWGGR
jgi:hypothetical protein